MAQPLISFKSLLKKHVQREACPDHITQNHSSPYYWGLSSLLALQSNFSSSNRVHTCYFISACLPCKQKVSSVRAGFLSLLSTAGSSVLTRACIELACSSLGKCAELLDNLFSGNDLIYFILASQCLLDA